MNKPEYLPQIDASLRGWAHGQGGVEHQFPVLISGADLQRAGYHEAFPHLLMTAGVSATPSQRPSSLQDSGWCLSPAVCYHAYLAYQGTTLPQGVKVSARGHCFRNEDLAELKPGRRQVEFQMRELVLIGAKEWIDQELEGVMDDIRKLAGLHELTGDWQPASDPFFLPTAQGKAHMQKLLGTKLEYCLPDGLAIASINRHGSFFGERFSIQSPHGQPVSSACVAFGLDRWASHAHPHH